jgi:hypothetical protein
MGYPRWSDAPLKNHQKGGLAEAHICFYGAGGGGYEVIISWICELLTCTNLRIKNAYMFVKCMFHERTVSPSWIYLK